jgi:tRNA-(ms[2]io[6]A)-hydroxylase
MSRLAREELVHFELVLDELRRRRVRFRGLHASGYAAALMAAVRPPSPSSGSWLGDRTVDEMLVCALIEARSHERLALLAGSLAGRPLGDLYARLRDAEERHGAIYLDLAREVAGGDVGGRLAELAAHEARVVARPRQPLRMHAGG